MRPAIRNVRAVARVGPATAAAGCNAEGDALHDARIEAKAAEMERLGLTAGTRTVTGTGTGRAARAVRCRCGCGGRWPAIWQAAKAVGRSSPTLIAHLRSGLPIDGHALEYAD